MYKFIIARFVGKIKSMHNAQCTMHNWPPAAYLLYYNRTLVNYIRS